MVEVALEADEGHRRRKGRDQKATSSKPVTTASVASEQRRSLDLDEALGPAFESSPEEPGFAVTPTTASAVATAATRARRDGPEPDRRCHQHRRQHLEENDVAVYGEEQDPRGADAGSRPLGCVWPRIPISFFKLQEQRG